MSIFSTRPTARKTHKCQYCPRPIEPGQRYVRTTAAPWAQTYDGAVDEWQTVRAHEVCEEAMQKGTGPPEGYPDSHV